ncbi:hypothetical protein LTR17_001015 [Elasticomyces elasticus]|nr:hypothetical protein LTR17_001015 [Elasticomyces elasticus]
MYRKRVNEEFKHYPRLFVEQEIQEYLTANDVNVDVLRQEIWFIVMTTHGMIHKAILDGNLA